MSKSAYLILVVSILLSVIGIGVVSAYDEFTTYKIVYGGSTAIRDSVASKSNAGDQAYTMAKASETAMKSLVYPLKVELPVKPLTDITIVKCRYDAKINTMGYWIEATRGGKEVAVNNPIWIYPAPYQVVVSEVFDAKLNEATLTIKEDPKGAAEEILQRHVDSLPLGKSVTGAKE
jgi:hypothetical protein